MNFLNFLNEAKEQLDISILSAGKYLTSAPKILKFLTDKTLVEHKTDGVKLTIIKKDNNSKMSDYIFSYKGNILYSEEYNYQPSTKVKSESIGASQFKAVFQHFSKLNLNNSIPVGTELFVEFLMKKPTLSSNYNTKHKMVLIGHTKSTFVEKFGKLKTNPGEFETAQRDEYAKILKIDVPQVLFDGVLGNINSFEVGIKHKLLSTEFNKVKNSFSWDNPENLLDDIRLLFLSIESKYGGQEEGVVLKTKDNILKFQQEYQLDATARLINKLKYRQEDPLLETEYWNNVKRTALEITSAMVIKSRKLPDLLSELSLVLKRLKLDFKNSKKTPAIIKDDIQLNAKTLIIKSLKGNNNVLIIGKFRVFTKEGHYKLIKRALKLYDNVVVCVVTSKDTKDTKDIRTKMLKETFPEVEIIHAINGNLIRIMNKSPFEISTVYAGSDRVQDYKAQVKHSIGISIKEMLRTSSDISASKIIEKISDEEYFKKNTPKSIHKLYSELLTFYET